MFGTASFTHRNRLSPNSDVISKDNNQTRQRLNVLGVKLSLTRETAGRRFQTALTPALKGRLVTVGSAPGTHTPGIAFRHLPPNSKHRFPATSYKLRASLSGNFLQTLPDLVTPLKGYSLSPSSCPATRSAPTERFLY